MSDTILALHTQQCGSRVLNQDKVIRSPAAEQLNIPEEEIQNHPWKYLGYRIYSRWAGSEKAFLVVRQFSTLNARIILALQDDISLLEQQLDLVEKNYSQLGPEDHDNGSFRRDIHTERKILQDKIYVALEKYS